MTINSCIGWCVGQGYPFAGLQVGAYCFCGNSYGSQGAASTADCNSPCRGQPSVNCGGPWRNSIWATRSFFSPPPFSHTVKDDARAFAFAGRYPAFFGGYGGAQEAAAEVNQIASAWDSAFNVYSGSAWLRTTVTPKLSTPAETIGLCDCSCPGLPGCGGKRNQPTYFTYRISGSSALPGQFNLGTGLTERAARAFAFA